MEVGIPNINVLIRGRITSYNVCYTKLLRFGGWYTEHQCINSWNFSNDQFIVDTVLYAEWDDVNVASIEVDKSAISLLIGNMEELTEKIYPINALNKNVLWKSDDVNVATVVDGVILRNNFV